MLKAKREAFFDTELEEWQRERDNREDRLSQIANRLATIQVSE